MKRLKLTIYFCLTLLVACESDYKKNEDIVASEQQIIIDDLTETTEITFSRENMQLLQEELGDLDGDGQDELVYINNTDNLGENGTIRELVVCKIKDGEWTPWITSTTAIFGSEGGGMMGEPFESIEIKEGILITHHQGGSSWKWHETSKYRYQNDNFYLIGATSTYGKPCEYWENTDINLSTGEINFNREYEKCPNYHDSIPDDIIENFIHAFDSLPKMTNMTYGELEIKTPKHKQTIFI